MTTLSLFGEAVEVQPTKKLMAVCDWKVSEVDVIYKSRTPHSELPRIGTSRDSYEVLKRYWPKGTMELRETALMIVLSRANKALGVFKIADGAQAGCIIDPKIVFQTALKVNGASIIIAHNHPSGNRGASQADIDITRRIKEAGKFLEIQVLDHVIIVSDGYFSFADEGMI